MRWRSAAGPTARSHRIAPGTAVGRSRYVTAPSSRHHADVAGRGQDIRDALIRQWEAIAAALPAIDPDRPSRVAGWSNREVIAHLTLQPALLLRFLATASVAPPAVSLAANLAGTKTLAGMIDRSAHEAAAQGRLDSAVAVGRVVPNPSRHRPGLHRRHPPGVDRTRRLPGHPLHRRGGPRMRPRRGGKPRCGRGVRRRRRPPRCPGSGETRHRSHRRGSSRRRRGSTSQQDGRRGRAAWVPPGRS